ncbi:MAG: M48 family metalloprotease [Chloroflexota bacterium]
MGSRKRWLVFLLISVCLLLSPGVAAAQEPLPERDPVFEQEILDRLAVIHADAPALFQLATQYMDQGDYEAARQAFEQVLDLAPGFPDALRRLSYVFLELGEVEAGMLYARSAYQVEDSPLNAAGLASALLATEDQKSHQEALQLARSAAEAMPNDAYINAVLFRVGVTLNNQEAIRISCNNLVVLQPEHPVPHYFLGILAAFDEKWELAERELLLSQELGMPADQVQEALAGTGTSNQMHLVRLERWSAYTLVGWVAGMFLLFMVGIVLSQVTLASAQKPFDTTSFGLRWPEKLVRGFYRVVIALTSLYFYISIPLLVLIIIAAVGGLIYLFLEIGRIPIKLALMILFAGLYTLYAIVRSLFTRIKDNEPGRLLPPQEAPQLWSLVTEVAQKLGTRPVDAIYITAGTDIAVLERGGMWKKLRGAGQRCLVLGLGVLSEMTQGQFQAILAHEYGHFSNKDTAGGNLARQVQVSVYNMAYGLAATGQANWYNPAWLFVNGFHRVFARITLGASRLQEILADRYAVLAYGVSDFVEGLKHVVQQSLKFNAQASQAVQTSLQQGVALQNIYDLPELAPGELKEKLDRDIQEALSRPTSPYDSHPAIQERIRLAQHITHAGTGLGSSLPVWDLLPNAQALQDEMTSQVRANVERQVQQARVIRKPS